MEDGQTIRRQRSRATAGATFEDKERTRLSVALQRGRDYDLKRDLAAGLSRSVFKNAALAAERLARPLINFAWVKPIQSTLLGASTSGQSEGKGQKSDAHKRHYITQGHKLAATL